MSENFLYGKLPAELGNLQKLEAFQFAANNLSGEIPGSIFNISTLRIISLTDNDFSGSLPSDFGQRLQNLERFYLGGNKLSGAILDSMVNASNLVSVGISENNFGGSIPNRLGDLRFLESLVLEQNNFTSKSDDSSGELTFLSSLSNCRSLQHLSFANNPIKGSLPSSIGNFSSSLQDFYAGFTEMEGEIPIEIANLSGLSVLSLRDNKLHGSIPLAFLENLQGLSLEGNELHGPIPSTLCSSRKLYRLHLGRNHLIGPIPECLGNVTSLRALYLDNNPLNTSIPATIWNLKDLLELSLTSTNLVGNIPPEIGGLIAAQTLDLSDNKISGNIPSTIGGLTRLTNLSLAQNELEGTIPQSLGGLISLEILDLSHNNLSGEVPTSLESISSLKYFNVSFNHLGGKVPSNGSFSNLTKESFTSNEEFCDGPPQLDFSPCRNNSPRGRGSSRKRLRIILDTLLPVASVIFAASIVFIMIRNRRKKKNVSPKDAISVPVHERISYYQLQQATKGFSGDNLIATGSFGSVYKGVLEDGTMLAIKVFNLELEGALRSFEVECEMWRNLRHRNLVRVISACSNPDFKALVLEYMNNGSLENWLHSDGYFLDFLQRLNITIDVACALGYLHQGHSSPVIHCDLKPSNILLDDDLNGRVTDFGIAKLFSIGENMVRTKTIATIGYIAPGTTTAITVLLVFFVNLKISEVLMFSCFHCRVRIRRDSIYRLRCL